MKKGLAERVLVLCALGALLFPSLQISPVLGQAGYSTEVIEAWVRAPNGNQLYVRVTQPARTQHPNQRFPAVIEVPGGLGSGAPMQLGVAAKGFVEVHFNAEGRGDGRPNNLRSQGLEDYNGRIHQDDLRTIIEYVSALPNVANNNIGVVSHSYGITMAAGCLGRHPEFRVSYLIDDEGPSDRYVTSFAYSSDPARVESAYRIFGHRADDTSGWWEEREAINFISRITARYLRVQAERDHAQPAGFYDHAIKLVNAATETQYGGQGKAPWTRVNGPENRPNQVYGPNDSPIWLTGRARDHPQLIQSYIYEMASDFNTSSADEEFSALLFILAVGVASVAIAIIVATAIRRGFSMPSLIR